MPRLGVDGITAGGEEAAAQSRHAAFRVFLPETGRGKLCRGGVVGQIQHRLPLTRSNSQMTPSKHSQASVDVVEKYDSREDHSERLAKTLSLR